MVIGYNCTNENKFRMECKTGENGERLCPNCGHEVIGITGTIRGGSNVFFVTFSDMGSEEIERTVNSHSASHAFDVARKNFPELAEEYIITDISR